MTWAWRFYIIFIGKGEYQVGQAGNISFISLNANNIVHLLRRYKHAFYAIPNVSFGLLLGSMGTNQFVLSSYGRYTGRFILCLCIEGGLI